MNNFCSCFFEPQFFLIYGGIIFFNSEGLHNDKGLTLFILGGLSKLSKAFLSAPLILSISIEVFVPGSYASFILFGAWMRWRGFTYDLIPSYDD